MLRKALLWVAFGATVVVLAAASEPPAPAPSTPVPGRVHAPGAQLERAVTDVVLACLRDDAVAAFEGMERLEASCSRLTHETAPSRGALIYDQALHTALERSRQLVRTNHVTEAFDQFVWVMRACRQCHEMIRRDAAEPKPAQAGSPPQAEQAR